MRKGMTVVEVLIVLAICFILLLLCGGCIGGCAGGVMPDYSEGSRVGTLYKVSHKGIIWKSWECQMLLNEFQLGQQSNVFEFSTQDEKVAQELIKHQGKRVEVVYSQYLISPISQSTAYTAKSIKEQSK